MRRFFTAAGICTGIAIVFIIVSALNSSEDTSCLQGGGTFNSCAGWNVAAGVGVILAIVAFIAAITFAIIALVKWANNETQRP